VFLKEREVFLTNDAWGVVVDLNNTSYTEAISIIREDLSMAREQRKEFRANSQLKQTDALLNNWSSELGSCTRYYPG